VTTPASRGELPAHVTTPLLTLITARSMDEDYAFVAEKRAAEGPRTGGTRRTTLPTALAVALFGVMVAVGTLSMFMNNIGAVAVLLPVMFAVSRRSGYPVSKLLIPLSFASLLGGLVTLIGTPPNLNV
jgi:hypothetical protein